MNSRFKVGQTVEHCNKITKLWVKAKVLNIAYGAAGHDYYRVECMDRGDIVECYSDHLRIYGFEVIIDELIEL